MLDAVDLFAAAGGWDEGARQLGLNVVGIELEGNACRTAQAAGHQRVQADVATLDPARMADVPGLIASPPCTGFTVAGLGKGRGDLTALQDAVCAVWEGADPAGFAAPDAALALQPVRYAAAMRPAWIALEQVREVLPLWQAVQWLLRGVGYSCWTGVLDAADYGVPQNRQRAILLASRDRQAQPPAPSHCADPQPDLFSDGLPAWCSMRAALPHLPAGTRLRSNYGSGGDPAARTERCVDRPALTVTSKAGRNYWLLPDGTRQRVTVAEAASLQTFPADYPWHGGMTSAYEQLGNAVPPLLARQLLGMLVHGRNTPT